MEEVTCPNCKERFKGDASRKYFDCPNCRFEFSNPALTKNQLNETEPKPVSLMEKINRAKQNT